MGLALKVRSLLYVCKTSPRGCPIRRRFQIALVMHRYKRTWKHKSIQVLCLKYGAVPDA